MHDDSIRMSWPLHPTPGIDDNPIFPHPCPFARLPPQKARKRKKPQLHLHKASAGCRAKVGLFWMTSAIRCAGLCAAHPSLFYSLVSGEGGKAYNRDGGFYLIGFCTASTSCSPNATRRVSWQSDIQSRSNSISLLHPRCRTISIISLTKRQPGSTALLFFSNALSPQPVPFLFSRCPTY